jgi:hypothetical protein
MELVYVFALEAKFCEFESRHPHQIIKGELLCRQKKHYKKHTAVFQKKLVMPLIGISFQHGEV